MTRVNTILNHDYLNSYSTTLCFNLTNKSNTTSIWDSAMKNSYLNLLGCPKCGDVEKLRGRLRTACREE